MNYARHAFIVQWIEANIRLEDHRLWKKCGEFFIFRHSKSLNFDQ